jgi:hypothetical protein
LMHVSSSSCVWATLSLVMRATLTGLGRFLASVAFCLSSVLSLYLSIALTRHCPDCWSAHIKIIAPPCSL